MNVAARLLRGCFTAGFVFASVAAYAFLSPAVYRSTSIVEHPAVEPKRDALALSLDLERSLLEPAFLRKLAAEVAPRLDHAALAETLTSIRSSLDVDSLDGSKFVISYRDSSSARAQWICDVFARRAVVQLPRVLAPPPEVRRSKAEQDLMAFLSRHPELATAPVAASPADPRATAPSKESPDKTLLGLRSERWHLANRLSELAKAPPAAADNPYPDGNDDAAALRRRLLEIDATLASPRYAVTVKVDDGLSPEVRSELRKLLAAFESEKIRDAAAETTPLQSAKVTSPAKRALQPLSPPRKLLLWIGALLGFTLGIVAAALPGAQPNPRPRRVNSGDAPLRGGTEKLAVVRPVRHDTYPVPLPLVRPVAKPVAPKPAPPSAIPAAEIVEIPAQAPEPPPASAQKREDRRTLLMGTLEVREAAAASPDSEPIYEVEPDQVRPAHDNEGTAAERPPSRGIVSYSEIVEQAALVAPYEVPLGWHPDSSLDVARMRSMARDLYPLVTEQSFALAVTATSGAVAAKSRTAAELALALAELAHRRVLLLEGNFTRPAIQRWMRLKIPNGCGFTRQLQAYAERRLYGGWKVARCTQWLDVCAEGAVRTPGAILAEHFVNALAELERHYGFIVIDGPSLEDTSDCRALDRSVQGVVVVRDSGTTLSHSRLSSVFSEKRFSTVIEAAA